MFKKSLTVLLMYFLTSSVVIAEEISRLEIQNFFHDTPGNASYMPFWEQKYLNQHVNWSGQIFSIQYQKDFNRTEITMKVLPNTFMYDTVVYCPGDISKEFTIKDKVDFTGSISRGIDLFGVKEVQIIVGPNLGDRFGNFVFTENGFVNVNFLASPDKTRLDN